MLSTPTTALKCSLHRVLQWIPPHERAKAVSLSTSGMYLGSAGAMLVLPSVAAWRGAPSLLRLVGCLGLLWLLLWSLVGREVPHRCRHWLPGACFVRWLLRWKPCGHNVARNSRHCCLPVAVCISSCREGSCCGVFWTGTCPIRLGGRHWLPVCSFVLQWRFVGGDAP